MRPRRLYRRGAQLALLGNGGTAWYCVAAQHVFANTASFTVEWFEQDSEGYFYKSGVRDRVDQRTIISSTRLLRAKSELGDRGTKQWLYRLPNGQRMKVEKMLNLRTQSALAKRKQQHSQEVDEKGGNETKTTERTGKRGRTNASDEKIAKKAKADKTIVKKSKTEKNAKIKNLSRMVKPAKQDKGPKACKPTKKAKPAKVDKSNPNWRLKPNPVITVWERDPLFETNEPVPFVSSLAHSRLVIRAVLTKNKKLLEDCVRNREEIASLHVRRSIASDMTAFRYAIKMEDLEAVIIILRADTGSGKDLVRCSMPNCLLPTQGTGTYNYRSLGIKKIRQLNLSRGSREGNNAFTKDQSERTTNTLPRDIMTWNISPEFTSKLLLLKGIAVNKQSLIDNIHQAVRMGHRELAAYYIQQDLRQGSQQFSKFFVDALLGTGNPWLHQDLVREASVKKKASQDNMAITPLHCACINPDTGPLEALFAVCPDPHLADHGQKKLVHYAAVCSSPAPLEFLVEKGANLNDTDSCGLTPLMGACQAGRKDTASFILHNLKSKRNQFDVGEDYIHNKVGPAGENKPGKDSWCPLHLAVVAENDSIGVVEVLIKAGALLDKPLSTRYDKMTALMLASANGDLAMVKLLIGAGARVEYKDRYKRTALIHAVMNGAANVVSYLLSIGANPNQMDSSKNSCLHYACAYGWLSCCHALLAAGSLADTGNEWKLSPLSVAILKGHKGIADYLITLPNVNVNVQDDKGRTILLNMLVDQGDWLTQEKVDYIINFVEQHNADPSISDREGKNALHYVADYKIGRYPRDEHAQLRVLMQRLAVFFVRKGVSTVQCDSKGLLPIHTALLNKVRENKYPHVDLKPDFVLARILLDAMVAEARPHKDAGYLVRQLMLGFVTSISPKFGREYADLFEVLLSFVSAMKENNPDLKDDYMDEIFPKDNNDLGDKRKPAMTNVFAEFCKSYASHDFSNLQDQNKSDKNPISDLISPYLGMLIKFINIFNPRLQSQSFQFSSLLELSSAKDNFMAFEMIMLRGPDITVTDSQGKDALFVMIERRHAEGVKVLINAGAPVNRTRIQPKTCGKKEIKDCPLLYAIRVSDTAVVEVLLRAGVSQETLTLTGQSAMHVAVKMCAVVRSKANLQLVKLLLDYGGRVNDFNACRQTPLHTAILNRADTPDTSLDLELLLIKHGASTDAQDDAGRTPLHYAFVKSGAKVRSGHQDPIQIVKALVENLDRLAVDIKDRYACSPLHYAAYRGATICSILLLQHGADIEAKDREGQTPLALAVLGKHDGCALMLIQHDANVGIRMLTQPWELEKPEKPRAKLLKFLPQHFEELAQKDQSLFQGVIHNNWLGLTYIVIEKMEAFGFQLPQAIEITFQLKRFQLGKTLLGQMRSGKLQYTNNHGQNLVHILALESTGIGGQHEKEVVEDLVIMLVEEKGIDIVQRDTFGCTPLHYACLNKNLDFIKYLLKQSPAKSIVNLLDNNGRNALSALFWNYEIGEHVRELTTLLLIHGANPNMLVSVPPISHINDGYESRFNRSNYLSTVCNVQKVTPLMIATCHKDMKMIQLLVSQGSTPTSLDSQGNGMLVYAFKTNDKAFIGSMIELLHRKSMSLESQGMLAMVKHSIAIDPENQSSLSYDDPELLKMLKDTILDLRKLGEYQHALVDLAQSLGADNIVQFLSTEFEIPFHPRVLLPPRISGDRGTSRGLDCQKDAEQMITHFEQQQKDIIKQQRSQPGCTVTDGHIHKEYNILLNKVDVGFGKFGLYNFYRLQVWQEAHKQLWVLFTNWGRIERWGRGQYQNTPFSSPEEAEAEFRKIFQSKTGNEWEARECFANKPGKYRIVAAEHAEKVTRLPVKIEWTTTQRPDLPIDQLALLRDLADVQMLKEAYTREAPIDASVIPFGRLKKTILLSAQRLLEDMLPLIKQRETLDAQNESAEKTSGFDSASIFDQLSSVLTEICRLSSEYHFLVPQPDREYEKVLPVDSLDRYNEEKLNLQRLLDFEVSEALILGAMLNRETIHPLCYIHQALDCQIQAIDEKSQEAQLILEYMYRSRGAADLRVEAIYRIQREAERNSFQETKAYNRKLLWHGTKKCHLLSILKGGLVVNPLYAQTTGRSFGDGIYFADVFDKSIAYSDGQLKGHSRYILLCDVDLGHCKKYEKYRGWLAKAGRTAGEEEDSLWVVGTHAPDPIKDVKTVYGYRIPLGRIIAQPEQLNLHYSEYVVFNTDNIAIRYLIKLGDGEKIWTMDDFLYNKKEEEEELNGDGEGEEEEEEEEKLNGNGEGEEDEEEEKEEEEEVKLNNFWRGQPVE